MSDQEIHEIAREVSGLIREAEEATDNAVVAIANLMAGAVKARRRAGVRSVTGQPTLLRLNRALDRVINGGSDVLRVHGDLHGHYSEEARGDTHPYTDETFTSAKTPLKVVGGADRQAD